MKKIIPLVLLSLIFTFCSQEKKLLRHAANAVERSEFEKAVGYYDQVIQKDSSSFFGNAGKGVVLSEFMSRHEQAIPYLEKALKNTPDKTKPILNSNLGRSYHFVGNYERALLYYTKSQKDNDPKWADYDEFLTKRIEDCKYAVSHPKIALPENQSITNVGPTINTELPEYTPVTANGKMYFTSKRKDSSKEKRNGIDGKFYEAIYVTNMNNDGTFTAPERYTLPKSKKGGEAIMSISPDGQKMFIYQGGKIYESDVNSPDHKTEALDENVNFANLQNHAALSPDGKTLYFTSESNEGRGGTDIYMSTMTDDGKWSDPKMLDFTINSKFDEDAPFVNEAGTLFFSSNGHPGYGGFDVYKSNYVNGAWTAPENLGQPINSPGDDIYFTLGKNSSKGYYASARVGGYGDLDIYKVHYVTTETTPCQNDEMLIINTTPEINNPKAQTVSLAVPESYKNNVRSYRWEVNGEPQSETGASFQKTFEKAGTYKLNAQLVVYCDSCPTLISKCAQKELVIEEDVLLTDANNAKNESAGTKGKGKNKKGKVNEGKNDLASGGKSGNKSNTKTDNSADNSQNMNDQDNSGEGSAVAATTSGKSGKKRNNKNENNSPASTDLNSDENSGSGASGEMAELGDTELSEMNWNRAAIGFGYNESGLSSEVENSLNSNLEILKNKKNLQVVINGYADSRGNAEYNKALSLKRAKAVKQYLVNHGLATKRIKSVNGLGETNLTNDCTDGVECSEEQHEANRRVEVQVYGPKKVTITQN